MLAANFESGVRFILSAEWSLTGLVTWRFLDITCWRENVWEVLVGQLALVRGGRQDERWVFVWLL